MLSLAGSKVDKARLWEALIPSMGYMALLRNLRNFDEAGVSDDVAQTVAARLADPGQVATSRQLPMRFLSAHRAAPSLRWGYALEQALGHSLANIPELAGRTLILVDTSGSMNSRFSKDGSLMRWDAVPVPQYTYSVLPPLEVTPRTAMRYVKPVAGQSPRSLTYSTSLRLVAA